MTRSILSVSDLSKPELHAIFERIRELKPKIQNREAMRSLHGQIVGLYFEKPSTRTRSSFEVATMRLSGQAVYLPSSELQSSRGEPTKDTARVLGSYLDSIVSRVDSHDTVQQLADHSGVSVVNALSNLEHPTQIISDLFTILETKNMLEGLNLAYIGDGNNVCNSLPLGAALTGMNMTVACPDGYEPNRKILEKAGEVAKKIGSKIQIMSDPKEAARSADILYTDTWVSMGQENELAKRAEAFHGYQVDHALLSVAKPSAAVMHCLPAHRGQEISDEVIEGNQSIVWEQARNKLFSAAAVLEFLLATDTLERETTSSEAK